MLEALIAEDTADWGNNQNPGTDTPVVVVGAGAVPLDAVGTGKDPGSAAQGVGVVVRVGAVAPYTAAVAESPCTAVHVVGVEDSKIGLVDVVVGRTAAAALDAVAVAVVQGADRVLGGPPLLAVVCVGLQSTVQSRMPPPYVVCRGEEGEEHHQANA
jgi:hypothetical protein